MEPTPCQTTAPLPRELPNQPSLYPGLPRATAGQTVTVLANTGYTVGYSEARQNGLWPVYHVFRTNRAEAGLRLRPS